MRNLILLFALSVFFITSCGNDKNPSDNTSSQSSTKSADMANHPGALTYKKFCASCHQSNGAGVPGMYPPIIETEKVNGDKNELIGIILNGMEGEIEVKGEIYDNVMPSHKHLTDSQVADLLTYLRANFGNASGEITAEEVKLVRESSNL